MSPTNVDDLLNKLLQDIKPQEVSLEDTYDEAAVKAKDAEVHRKGWENFYKLRNKWSIYLMITLGLMIFFQTALTVAVGLHWLDFTNYKNLIYVVISENFIQIVGMAYIVVEYLFKNSFSDYKKQEESGQNES